MDKQTLLGIQAALHQRAVIANLIALQTKHSHLIFRYESLERENKYDMELYRLSREINATLAQITEVAQNLTFQTAADQEVLVAGDDFEAGETIVPTQEIR
jgi:hypothetical protein